jgi:hypothetical protein
VEQGGVTGLTGAAILAGDPALARLLEKRLLARAAAARRDIKVFAEFVVREFRTKRPVRLAPHQKVGLDFIMGHARSVNMWPRGHSKSWSVVALTLFLMGQDPNARGAILSATQQQAATTLRVVADYIELSDALHLVFPHLRKSARKHDVWNATTLTIERPPGTRDPSLVALGLDGAVLGRRLNWLVIDDLLTDENTATPEQRKKVIEFVDGSVLGTLDYFDRGSRVVMVNTPFHPEDILHYASETMGWATLQMEVDGDVLVRDDRDPMVRLFEGDEWDHELLRPSARWRESEPLLRLAPHDPDPQELLPLWPEEFPRKRIDQIQRSMLPHLFLRNYKMQARDPANAWCKREWIDECKRRARLAGVFGLIDRYVPGPNELVFTGVDLGILLGEHNDDTAYFTYVVLPSGVRRILDIDFGKFDSVEKITKIQQKVRDYGSCVVVVESNAGQQLLVDFALDKQADLPVMPYQTTAMKAHAELGLPGLFLEIYNGAWLIPQAEDGSCDARVERWVGECVNYVPDKHTGDVLMASWLAQQGARKWGITTGPQAVGEAGGFGEYMQR